jgi:hypothetical protein
MAIESERIPQTKYKVILVAFLVLVAWLTVALVKAKNQRDALSTGLCVDKTMHIADYSCLAKISTRTAWYWHIYYGLTS